MLSKSCTYGILATVYVGLKDNNHYVPIRDISENLNIPFHFLTKILQVLTAHKIMLSHRGPHGGVMLAKKPELITVYDIITAFDGDAAFSECLLKLADCNSAHPCPVHEAYSEYKSNMKNLFGNTTIEQLAYRVNDKKIRLTNTGINI